MGQRIPPRRQLPVWLEASDFHQASGFWAREIATGVEQLDLLIKYPFGSQDWMMAVTIRRDGKGRAVPVGMKLDPRKQDEPEEDMA